jgi:hypothetical protein
VKLGRILLAAPELQSRASGLNGTGHATLVEHVAQRMQVPSSSPSARTLVVAMSAVATTEYQRWIADGGQGNPSDRIVAALDLIIDGLGTLDKRLVSAKSSRA